MSRKKSFVTIFTDCRNFHLVKDVGQIPYFMIAEGYESTLVTYKNEEEYPFNDDETRGLKLTFIPDRGRSFYFENSVVAYLLKHSKSIDVLNLYHFKKENVLYFSIYKSLNPGGKAYLKLDINLNFFKTINTFFLSHFRLKHQFLQWLMRRQFRQTDLFSIETQEGYEYLTAVFPELRNKMSVIPNGIDNRYIEQHLGETRFEEKENIILWVGKPGDPRKNVQLLLNACARVDLRDWKAVIIGPAEGSFEEDLDLFRQKFPLKGDNITYAGNISDRKQLFTWYKKAKALCLTSTWEGFPIVFPEALYFGDYIITTPVSSSLDVTDNGKCGRIAGDVMELSECLNELLDSAFYNPTLFNSIRTFSKERFIWPVIARKLSEKLSGE